MKNYLKWFYDEFDYPLEARAALDSAYDGIVDNAESVGVFEGILKKYDETRAISASDLTPKCEKIAEAVGVHDYTVKLLVHICLSRALRKYYDEKGVEYSLWYGAMSDLKWKLIECHLVKGIWGTFVADGNWFSRWYDLTRFAIGRLQFELIKFNKEYEKDGRKLTKDSKIINIHIPRTGTPLNHDEILASYEGAKKIFAKDFTDEPMAFTCTSWLLFPEHERILHEKSNIRKFMADFDIFTGGIYPETNKSALWRVFDCPVETPVEELPEGSFLQRAYKKYLLEGGAFGYGTGVFFA